MREVSCRTIGPMLDALDRRGIPRLRLTEGLGVGLEHVERPRARIDWDVFGELCARFEALAGHPALAEIGASSPRVPAMGAVLSVVADITCLETLYRVMSSVVVPSLFGCVDASLQPMGGRRLRVHITIPPEYRDIPQLFHILGGGLRINPATCGYAPAEVAMILQPRRAVYDVLLPATRPGLLRRLWRWFRGVTGARAGLAELGALRAELSGSYLALGRAQRRIHRQHAQLRRESRRRRRAEAEQRAAEARLNRAQKLAGIGLLAGGVAHDFNNLLTSIVGNAELALRTMPRDVDARRRIEAIRVGADRAAALTEQLQADAGRRPTATREIDLGVLVADARVQAGAAIPRRAVLHEELAPHLPACTGDPVALRQAVINLLINAAAAVEDTGGQVTLRTAVAQVGADRLARAWVPTEAAAGEYVYVEIADTGVGMGPATLARIFEPFFTTRARGRGLGLAAVLGIVRGHRGLIELESAPGRGSTFRVLLPSLGHPLRSPGADEPELWTGTGTILLAEDVDEVREATAGLLEAMGLTVMTAGDGSEALALALRHGSVIDAFLLDRSMPGLAGEEVFRALRAARRDARVVLFSGCHDDASTAALLSEGLVAALPKPFSAIQLAEAMRAALALADPS